MSLCVSVDLHNLMLVLNGDRLLVVEQVTGFKVYMWKRLLFDDTAANAFTQLVGHL